MENLEALYREACAAEDAYRAALQEEFPRLKHTGDVRYTPQGNGAPGSTLRHAADRKHAADAALRRAMTPQECEK